MKFRIFQIPVFLLPLLLLSCLGMTGEFGWALLDESKLTPLEKKIPSVQEFTVTRDKLVFPTDKTLVYLYKFSRMPNPEAEIYVSLSRFQVGFNEIEVNRKRPDTSNFTITGNFRELIEGKYLVKVSYEGEVIDSVEFRVIEPEGHLVEEDEKDSKIDDIQKYTKPKK